MCANVACALKCSHTLRIQSTITKPWGTALPSDVVKYLSLDEAIAIHERLIEKFGGTVGLRDMGLLESALFRPQTGYYADLAHMSAALFESLISNHAFVDGNKRAAFFFCDIFLRLNGWKLAVESEAAFTFIVGSLENGCCDFDHLLPWIQKHATKI